MANIEAEVTTFTAEGKKPSTVHVVDKKWIGQGSYGAVYQADVVIGSHARRFAIKQFQYRFRLGIDMGAEFAARSMANYKTAKEAGLKVFPTYRLGQDKKSILMTNGNSGSTICIGSDFQSSLVAREESRIAPGVRSKSFRNLIRGVLGQAQIATDHNISLGHSDVFFYFINQHTNELGFVLGDFDMLNPSPDENRRILLDENLAIAASSLSYFVDNNFEFANSYLNSLDKIYEKVRREQGL
jgi:hypothetical protein